MEMQPVSYRLFSCLAFGRVSVPSLYALSLRRQEAGRPYHWPVTTLRPWLYAALLSMGVYILAFPTIVSIMTGYQSNFAPYASDPDNPDALLPIGHLDMPDWVVRDGDRLDFAELYPVYKGETGYDLDSESDFITLKYCTSQRTPSHMVCCTDTHYQMSTPYGTSPETCQLQATQTSQILASSTTPASTNDNGSSNCTTRPCICPRGIGNTESIRPASRSSFPST